MRPNVIPQAFAGRPTRVVIRSYASQPAFDVPLQRAADAAFRELWSALAATDFLRPETPAQAKARGFDVSVLVQIEWACYASGGMVTYGGVPDHATGPPPGCYARYYLHAYDRQGRSVWEDSLRPGVADAQSGTDALVAGCYRLMREGNRLAVSRLQEALATGR